MTNENAIMRLMLVRHRNDNTDMLNEALDMAIEALQRGLENVNADSCSEKPNRSEPKTAESGSVDSEMPEIKTDRTIGGMIYRQAAIDAIQKWGLIDGLSEGQAIEILADEEKVPSAQPERKKGEWIPCERELPEVGRSILVSVGGIYTAEGCLRDDGDWTQFRWDAIQRKDMVGAWMPLPSPYTQE